MAYVVENGQSGEELLEISDNGFKPYEKWVIDKVYTFHMCPNRDQLVTYEGVSRGTLIMENNATCKITGVGTIRIKMFNGVIRTLVDIGYVLEPKQNLIFFNTLDSHRVIDILVKLDF